MRPDFAVAQDISQHIDLAGCRQSFRYRAAGQDIIMLLPAEMLVLGRVAIDQPIGAKIGETEKSGDGKAPTPANPHHKEGHNRHADDIGEFGGGIEYRR